MEEHLYHGTEARYNEYSILELLFDLGIRPLSPDGTLRGALDGPVLDIGCGRHANLVEHLNGSGLKAEGVDPDVLDELAGRDYLMKQKAEKIPRSDGYYGTALSHMSLYQGGMLFAGFMWPEKRDGDFVEAYKEFYREHVKPELMATLKETKRVLRPGGKFIIHPIPLLWLMDVDSELKSQGYSFIVEDVPPFIKKVSDHMKEMGMEYMKRLILKMPE